jgi:hypothetical protein
MDMQSLLASAFDKVNTAPTPDHNMVEHARMLLLTVGVQQLSSYDPLALRRGLRHVEALVAQLTLPMYQNDGRVGDDARLLEFLQLQDSFEWNGMSMQAAYCSVSATAYCFGSVDCKGHE